MVKAVEVRGGRLDAQPAARVDRPHAPVPPLLRLPRLQVKVSAAQRLLDFISGPALDCILNSWLARPCNCRTWSSGNCSHNDPEHGFCWSEGTRHADQFGFGIFLQNPTLRAGWMPMTPATEGPGRAAGLRDAASASAIGGGISEGRGAASSGYCGGSAAR